MKNQLIALLGTTALLAACQPADDPPTKDRETSTPPVGQGNQTDAVETPSAKDMKAEDISQDEGVFLPSDAGQSANPPAPPTIPRRMGSDPAGSALRYKEKADAVTQRMKEQTEETERYMQR